jgi:sensor c-di-GMP phosphodiesterase-like protein
MALVINISRKIGVNLAFDDFDIGCSLLTHSKQRPVSILKIDQSFSMQYDK